jgi:hypothetical protein
MASKDKRKLQWYEFIRQQCGEEVLEKLEKDKVISAQPSVFSLFNPGSETEGKVFRFILVQVVYR